MSIKAKVICISQNKSKSKLLEEILDKPIDDVYISSYNPLYLSLRALAIDINPDHTLSTGEYLQVGFNGLEYTLIYSPSESYYDNYVMGYNKGTKLKEWTWE